MGWKNSFNLPRGLFTDAIKKWFAENESHELAAQVEGLDRAGFIAKLIPLYFREKYQDDFQKYYNYHFNVGNPDKPKKANYLSKEERTQFWIKNRHVFTAENLQNDNSLIEDVFVHINNKTIKLYDKKQMISNVLLKLGLKDTFNKKLANISDFRKLIKLKDEIQKEKEKQYLNFKDWQKFEKELRLIKNQDALMWLMCRNLQTENQMIGLDIENLKLKNIDTDVHAAESLNILNRVLPMKLPITIYLTDDKGAILKQLPPLTTFYIEEKQTKVLKAGNFKALVKDRRLNCLFSFIDKNAETEKYPISKTRLEYELAAYQTSRIEIFEITLAIEKKLITQNPTLPADNFRLMIEKWLETKTNKDELQQPAKALIAIRNAFSHNQYPIHTQELFGEIKTIDLQHTEIFDKGKGLNIALQLTHYTKKLKEIITQNI